MPRSVLRVGTRGSALALAQAENVRKAISQVISHRNFELVPITTRGDTHQGPIPPIGGKGLFTEDIQEALATGKIDLAVHSAKDLPVNSYEGVVLAAIPPREDPRDALITRHGGGLVKLPPGTTVGTSSLRRSIQLRALASGLVPTPIRGNVDTRLRKLDEEQFDAIILAAAGLTRLGLENRITQYFEPHESVPAVGQGIIGIECREDDAKNIGFVRALNDASAWQCCAAERAFAHRLEGSCQSPIAGFATLQGNELQLHGVIGSPDGREVYRGSNSGRVVDADRIGIALAGKLLKDGAEQLLERLRQESK